LTAVPLVVPAVTAPIATFLSSGQNAVWTVGIQNKSAAPLHNLSATFHAGANGSTPLGFDDRGRGGAGRVRIGAGHVHRTRKQRSGEHRLHRDLHVHQPRGDETKTASSGALTVTGLTAGKTYKCTVKATNSCGTGPASVASPAVVA
jgi:hypothetical protein